MNIHIEEFTKLDNKTIVPFSNHYTKQTGYIKENILKLDKLLLTILQQIKGESIFINNTIFKDPTLTDMPVDKINKKYDINKESKDNGKAIIVNDNNENRDYI